MDPGANLLDVSRLCHHVAISSSSGTGKWLTIVVRHARPLCDQPAGHHADQTRSLRVREASSRIAFVEIPPLAVEASDAASTRGSQAPRAKYHRDSLLESGFSRRLALGPPGSEIAPRNRVADA
jgi:hypothetical protein